MKATLGDKAIFWGTVLAFASTLVGLTAFSFSTFETKDDAKEKKGDLVKSLDEIKAEVHEINRKVDQLK